jgi:hypothetical protein
LKNNADLEAKAHFLHYIAENIQDQACSWFCAKEWNKNWSRFWEMDKNLIFHYPFKILEKIIVRSWSRNHKIFIINLAKGGGAYVQYFLDIVLERDVRNQAGIADFFWIFGIKNAEKFSIHHLKEITRFTLWRYTNRGFRVVIMPLQRKTIVGNLKINYGLMERNGFWSAKSTSR